MICKALSPPISRLRNPAALCKQHLYRRKLRLRVTYRRSRAGVTTDQTGILKYLRLPSLQQPEWKKPHSRVRWITWAAGSRLRLGAAEAEGARFREPRARVSARRAMSVASSARFSTPPSPLPRFPGARG